MRLISQLLMLSFTFILVTTSTAADLAREQRMSDEVVDAILDGDTVEISANDREFLSIFTETEEDKVKGSVLILHGRGFHPDWATVVQPLRVGLTEHGWNTLSIQMPVLEKSAKYNDYVEIFPEAGPRIEASLAFLHENTNGKVVIIAHSCGSHMAQNWIHKTGAKAFEQFDAYVGIGMGATDYKQPMIEPFALDIMPMPVLDVTAEEDFPAVLRMQAERKAMMDKAANPKSQQITIAGAEHYYQETGDALLESVAAWLETL